jgi:hypothetical protein
VKLSRCIGGTILGLCAMDCVSAIAGRFSVHCYERVLLASLQSIALLTVAHSRSGTTAGRESQSTVP